MARRWQLLAAVLAALLLVGRCDDTGTDDDEGLQDSPKVDSELGGARDGSRTDSEVVQREEEAIKLDGLNAAQVRELRERSEKHAFQAEVNRMMKIIINSLYKNKEIFLRELISNASDALDKIRLLSLTDPSQLDAVSELAIRIKVDRENNVLHVADTGIGMTKEELVKNLGTIAKSGTSEFIQKAQESGTKSDNLDKYMNDLIGQFGVGFYSSFLVADRVVVTSKSNNDKQHIWESDSASFSVVEDPRGDTLKRGSEISLYLKEEAQDYLQAETLKTLIKKYSQFIEFPIYLWTVKTETVEEPVEEADEKTGESTSDDEEAKVEGEDTPKKPKTKETKKTSEFWDLINETKPIWQRKPKDIQENEYNEFYKSISRDSEDPLTHVHFNAEGEVSFRSIVFVPKTGPQNMFSDYGQRKGNLKLYVRRVFITDDFEDMMPKYLSFIRGVIDSDDLPLNVSRETLQQHKILKVIKKKMVRKVLDMIKKIPSEEYREKFWKEYSTNIKLGVIEDTSNRSRLSKLLYFQSSNHPTELTNLTDYTSRMKDKQDAIYYIAGASRKEIESSPFVETLLKKGYEVLFLVEPVDEYCIQNLPDFEGKKLQNVAKDGIDLSKSAKAKERKKELESEYEPLTKWLQESGLKDKIEKARISDRLQQSPCALVANTYGWSGNMERIMKSQAYAKATDSSNEYYASQKKILEVNPYHPLVRELLKRVTADQADVEATDMAETLFEMATVRSGYTIKDPLGFANRIEKLLRKGYGIDPDAAVEVEDIPEDEPTDASTKEDDTSAGDDGDESTAADGDAAAKDEL